MFVSHRATRNGNDGFTNGLKMFEIESAQCEIEEKRNAVDMT